MGAAISNPSDSPVTVRLELSYLNGTQMGFRNELVIPPQGQVTRFLHEIFAPLANESCIMLSDSLRCNRFINAILQATSPTPIAVTGLRARYNSRREFLMTVIPVLPESDTAGDDMFFPDVANNSGFWTEFYVFGLRQPSSGVIQFRSQKGEPLSLPLR